MVYNDPANIIQVNAHRNKWKTNALVLYRWDAILGDKCLPEYDPERNETMNDLGIILGGWNTV